MRKCYLCIIITLKFWEMIITAYNTSPKNPSIFHISDRFFYIFTWFLGVFILDTSLIFHYFLRFCCPGDFQIEPVDSTWFGVFSNEYSCFEFWERNRQVCSFSMSIFKASELKKIFFNDITWNPILIQYYYLH